MEEVPLTSMRCGEWHQKQSSCFLSVTESSPRLDFIYRDGSEYTKFQCKDISAVDLRVEAKFGAIDALKGTIIVECLSPILVETGPVCINSTFSRPTFIIKATFNVNETGAVRDVVCQLRKACSSQCVIPSSSQEDINNENVVSSKNIPEVKAKSFKEGLPDWVAYIPHYLYSKQTRQAIEFAIFIYMIFSVMWALWQLYNHIDFVQESLQPLIDMVKYQYHLLDSMVQVLNAIFEEYTTQWLCLIKPLYTIVTTLLSPLLKLLAQLSPFFETINQAFQTICQLVGPIAKPITSIVYQIFKYIYIILTSFKTLIVRLWVTFCNVTVPFALSTHLDSVKRVILGVYHGLVQARHLDPLKAQFIVMRTTVISSCKALGLAIVHLVRQVYKFIWLKRSGKAVKKE